jgi:hypothetical protein
MCRELEDVEARKPKMVLMRFGTMGTTSPGLGGKEQGGLPRVSPVGLRARASQPITGVVYKIIIETNLVNRASIDRV